MPNLLKAKFMPKHPLIIVSFLTHLFLFRWFSCSFASKNIINTGWKIRLKYTLVYILIHFFVIYLLFFCQSWVIVSNITHVLHQVYTLWFSFVEYLAKTPFLSMFCPVFSLAYFLLFKFLNSAEYTEEVQTGLSAGL